MDWETAAAREEERYRDGLARLREGDADWRQKQLVRAAMAAGGAGLARLMQGDREQASAWLARSAERYRESYEAAPPGSWGRVIGAMKARVLAGDWDGACADARWTRAELGGADSAIAQYAAALAALILDDDDRAADVAARLGGRSADEFPRAVADALNALARRDADRYDASVRGVLRSFETRDAYLEDIPVADTVIVLERLAENRGIAVDLASALLPARG